MSSLTVVLPALPVTATTGSGKLPRQARAIAPEGARRVSSTSTCGQGQLGNSRYERSGRTFLVYVGDVIVAVEAFALDRDEQRAADAFARIGRDGGELAVRADEPPVYFAGLPRRDCESSTSVSERCSDNRTIVERPVAARRWFASFRGPCPRPGRHRPREPPARRQRLPARANGRLPGRDGLRCPSGCPRRSGAGSSPRGVVVRKNDVLCRARGCCAHFGAFAAVALAAATEHAPELARRGRGEGRKHAFRAAAGVCA